MPDSPDYSKYRVASTRVSLEDMGELAARLGAVQRLYREGTVILYDDFRNGLASITPLVAGVGSGVLLTSQRTFSGAYNLNCFAGIGANPQVDLEYNLAKIILGRIGFDICFSFVEVADALTIAFILAEQTTERVIRITLNFATNKIQYFGSDLATHDVADFDGNINQDSIIHFLKIVIDTDKGEYVKVILDDIMIDLTGIEFATQSGSFTSQNQFTIILDSTSGVASEYYLNHVIITADEP